LTYQLFFTKDAAKDAETIKKSPFYLKAKELLDIIRENPFQIPPKYEKLVGNYKGAYSRRINIQHRIVYEVIESEKIVKIISMWKHYE